MKNNNTYIFALTLVATLGGLLFGYDTAVISGTVESLRKFFIEPQGFPLDQANALEGFVEKKSNRTLFSLEAQISLFTGSPICFA